MPKQVTKTVYTFRELIAAAEDNETEVSQRDVDRARDWLREGATDYDWWEFVYSDWTEALEQVGFTDAKINFSGFWSQGDGASFTSGLDIEKLLTFFTVPIEPSQAVLDGEPGGWLPRVVKECGQTINRRYEWLFLALDYLSGRVTRTSHHYSHENTCDASIDFDFRRMTPELNAVIDAFQEDVEALRKDLCKAIYTALEEEYEWRVDDEQLLETSDANEYTFDADGRREG
jgi:hypothetical protein